MDFIASYIWIAWLVLILVFVTIEILTLQFTFLMLAVGSVVGMLSGFAGVPWWLQFIIAGAASVLLLLVVRPPLLRVLHRGADPAKSNVEALIGLSGQVTRTVTPHGGQIKLANGETWTARTLAGTAATSLEPGTRVTLQAVDGATAVVAPATSEAIEQNDQKENS